MRHGAADARAGDALGAATGLLIGDQRIAPDQRVPTLVIGSPDKSVASANHAGVVDVINPNGDALKVEASYNVSIVEFVGDTPLL